MKTVCTLLQSFAVPLDQGWANCGPPDCVGPNDAFFPPTTAPELVQKTAGERRFMLFTNIVHTYCFKNYGSSYYCSPGCSSLARYRSYVRHLTAWLNHGCKSCCPALKAHSRIAESLPIPD